MYVLLLRASAKRLHGYFGPKEKVGQKLSWINDASLTHMHDIQVRISYLDELDTREGRRSQLLSHFYFLCDCQRCVGVSYLYP